LVSFYLYQDAKLCLITFGGQQTDGWELCNSYLPDGWIGLVTRGVCGNGVTPPSKYRIVDLDSYLPDIVNAVDICIGKLGYGTVSEVLAHNTPFIFVPREHWNEQQYLLKLLQEHGTPLQMTAEDFYTGQWGQYLETAFSLHKNQSRKYRGSTCGARVVIEELENLLGNEEDRKIGLVETEGPSFSPGA